MGFALVPKLLIPLMISIYQTVGMAPMTARVKVRAEAEGKEVCIIIDGPEYFNSCRELYGVTWTQDFLLRVPGCYAVFAVVGNYRTPELKVKVIGSTDDDC